MTRHDALRSLVEGAPPEECDAMLAGVQIGVLAAGEVVESILMRSPSARMDAPEIVASLKRLLELTEVGDGKR